MKIRVTEVYEREVPNNEAEFLVRADQELYQKAPEGWLHIDYEVTETRWEIIGDDDLPLPKPGRRLEDMNEKELEEADKRWFLPH